MQQSMLLAKPGIAFCTIRDHHRFFLAIKKTCTAVKSFHLQNIFYGFHGRLLSLLHPKDLVLKRSIHHVCKFKERYHPSHPPPQPISCVAWTILDILKNAFSRGRFSIRRLKHQVPCLATIDCMLVAPAVACGGHMSNTPLKHVSVASGASFFLTHFFQRVKLSK